VCFEWGARFPYLATVNVCWMRGLINREIAAKARGKTRTRYEGISDCLVQWWLEPWRREGWDAS